LKITLVNPISGSVYSQFRRALIKRLPLGLAYVASYLESNGHIVSVVDADALDLEIDSTIEEVMRTAPDAVGVTATTPLINNAFNIIQRIKERDKRIITFVGGPHVSAMPEGTLQAGRGFLDYVVFGEGEDSCLELLRCIEGGGALSEPLQGIGFMNGNGEAVIGLQRPFKNDLDLFPFPARHLFPMDRYVDHTKFGDELYTLMTTSRGCPYECTFCGSQITWQKKTRLRSPENVVLELKECVEKYGITNFTFCDDTFTLNKHHAIEICRLISELPYKIRLFCSSRVNTISEDRLFWLKKAGCYCITFGLESGNDAVLKKMKKGITVEMIKRAVAMTKEAGIEVHGSFILGFEDEDEQTMEDTISFAVALSLDQIQFSILVPLPGTECYTHAGERNAFRCSPDDFTSFYWYYSVPANMTRVSDERLIELQKSAYERYNASKQKN
jgi:anaerobic magnesium-protoporphyrin IX monomethyl ester cyclase